jgi:hypothetical protein
MISSILAWNYKINTGKLSLNAAWRMRCPSPPISCRLSPSFETLNQTVPFFSSGLVARFLLLVEIHLHAAIKKKEITGDAAGMYY